MQILEEFIVGLLNLIWIELCLNFSAFFTGNSVFLPSLTCLAIEVVPHVL